MSTPDGISTEDWEVVHDFALESVSASVHGDDNELRDCRDRLFTYLDNLQEKYGELPSILATRADYTDDLSKKKQFLNRAYVLAKERNDSLNQLEIAHSLAKLYIEKVKDATEGLKWLDCFKHHIAQRDDSSRKEDYERLRKEIQKLSLE